MIQIDMQMPDNCVECRFNVSEFGYCNAAPENFCGHVNVFEEDGRPEWCPLKSQVPRVLTLEEAKSVEGYAWLECRDTPILRVSLFHDGYYIEPFEEPFRVDLMNWPDYNKEWRYWTSCPTDEQRETEVWND